MWPNPSPVSLLLVAALAPACGSSAPPLDPDAGPALSPCAFDLTADGTFDIDVPTVRITGRVTLNGGAAPAIADGPELRLRSTEDDSRGRLIALARIAAGNYDVRVIPGNYQVLYGYASCTDTRYPCQDDVVVREVELTSDGVVDLDLATVRITGAITYAGAPLPAATYARGRIALRGALDEVTTAADAARGTLLELDRAAATSTYAAEVFPGRYTLLYDNPAGDCTGAPYPCQSDVALDVVNLVASGGLDVDLAPARLTGRVTYRGGGMPAPLPSAWTTAVRLTEHRDPPPPPMPSSPPPPLAPPASRGRLVNLARAGAAGTYDVRVFPGEYELRYDNPAADCTGNPYPCQSDVVLRTVTVPAGGGSLDVDLAPVRVTGAVSLDGAALPQPSYGRGELGLRAVGDDDAGDARGRLVALDTIAAGGYDVHVFPGRYELLYTNATAGCTGDPMPCMADAVLDEVEIRDGVLDVDIPTVAIAGTITLDGSPLPASSYGRGRIALYGDRAARGTFVVLDDAVPTYRVRVIRGDYQLRYDNPAADCTGNPYPCQSDVPIATLAAHADGGLDLDLDVIRLAGVVRLDGGALPGAAYSRGQLALRGAASERGRLVALDELAGQDYGAVVFPGRYDVLYEDGAADCTGSPYPCQLAVLSCLLDP